MSLFFLINCITNVCGDIFCFVLSQIVVIFGIFGAKYSPFTHEKPYIYIHMCFYSTAVFFIIILISFNYYSNYPRIFYGTFCVFEGEIIQKLVLFCDFSNEISILSEQLYNKKWRQCDFLHKWWVAIRFMQFSWRYLFFYIFLPRAITH